MPLIVARREDAARLFPGLIAAIGDADRHRVRFRDGTVVSVVGSDLSCSCPPGCAHTLAAWTHLAVTGQVEERWVDPAWQPSLAAVARDPEAADAVVRLDALVDAILSATGPYRVVAVTHSTRPSAPVRPGRLSHDTTVEAWARAARSDEALLERRTAVVELRDRYGIAITAPAADAQDAWFVEDDQSIDLALAVRNAFGRGNRNVVLYGPPGVGKSTLPKRIAALLGMGYVQIACARGMDTVMLLGTDVIVHGANGQPVQHVRLGTLAAAAQYPVVIELAEAAELDGEFLTNLNGLLDDGVLTLWSAAPGEKIVHRHPECVIVLTANTGRGDRHLPESIDDRAGVNVVLSYPTEAEEATRIAVQALALLHAAGGPALARGDDAPPVAGQFPALYRRAVATQRLVTVLRGLWSDRTNPRAPGMRAAAHFLAELEQCLAAERLADAEDAARARARALRIALKRFVGLWNLAQHDPLVVEQELMRLATLAFEGAGADA